MYQDDNDEYNNQPYVFLPNDEKTSLSVPDESKEIRKCKYCEKVGLAPISKLYNPICNRCYKKREKAISNKRIILERKSDWVFLLLVLVMTPLAAIPFFSCVIFGVYFYMECRGIEEVRVLRLLQFFAITSTFCSMYVGLSCLVVALPVVVGVVVLAIVASSTH